MHLSKITLVDVVAAAVFVALASALGYRRRRGQIPFPPGPRGFPLIGHFLTFPKNFVWLTFTEWGQKYGGSCLSALHSGLISGANRRDRVRQNSRTGHSHSQYPKGSQGLARKAWKYLL
jgi:hypothetical protein